MPRARPAPPSPPPPTAAVRLVYGAPFRVARRPEGILSPVTAALQAIAKREGSRQPETWGVFPVFGRDVVVAGFLATRAPMERSYTFAIEPGGDLATTHAIVSFARSDGQPVGRIDEQRYDADCVGEIVSELAETPAWAELGATALPLSELPGGAGLDAFETAAHLLLTDDGRAGEVVHGMSFWRPGATYREGRVDTWTRAVGDGDAVRVVGVRLARVDASAPLVVAPATDLDALSGLREEVRAVLDSERPMATYLIADVPSSGS
jgi:hypothetical protein